MFPSTQWAAATEVAADENDSVEADKGEGSDFEVDALVRARNGQPQSRRGTGASMLGGPLEELGSCRRCTSLQFSQSGDNTWYLLISQCRVFVTGVYSIADVDMDA